MLTTKLMHNRTNPLVLFIGIFMLRRLQSLEIVSQPSVAGAVALLMQCDLSTVV